MPRQICPCARQASRRRCLSFPKARKGSSPGPAGRALERRCSRPAMRASRWRRVAPSLRTNLATPVTPISSCCFSRLRKSSSTTTSDSASGRRICAGDSVDTGLQAALSAWACHTGAAPGCPTRTRACSAPGVRSSAGRDRAKGCAATPWRRAFCRAEARGDLVPREAPYAARGAPRPALARGDIRRSFVSIRWIVEVGLDCRR